MGEFYIIALSARQLGVQTLSFIMLWAWVLPACRSRLPSGVLGAACCQRGDHEHELLHEETLLPSEREALERQAELQEYMARLMGEKLMEHQHKLSTLKLRLTLLNTPRQAGFLRARPSTDGDFDTYWAELRRDKRIYFFAHTAPQGSMPLFALELARVDKCSVVEVDGRSVGRPLIPKAPLLQLLYAEAGGKIQILSHALSFARGHRSLQNAAASGVYREPTSSQRTEGENTRRDARLSVAAGGSDGLGGMARVWQLMFPMDGQLAAWKHDIDRLMAANKVSLQPQFKPLKVWVGTWNAANLDPPFDHLPLAAWLFGESGSKPTCDLYAVGFQELGGGGVGVGGGGGGGASGAATKAAAGGGAGRDAEASGRLSVASSHAAPTRRRKSVSKAHDNNKPKYTEGAVLAAMAAALGEVLGDEFTLLEAVPMYQIQVFVFLRSSHTHHASRVAVAQVPTFRAGYNAIGTHATPKMLARRKGGVAISLSLGRTTFCFVTAHLAAHQGEKGQLLERNRHSVHILQHLLGDGRDACTCFDHLFFFGDLNYRLGSPELPDKVSASRPESVQYWDEVATDIANASWQSLYERDQLREQIASGRAFYGFDDGGVLPFAPTFKMGKEKKAKDKDKARRASQVTPSTPNPREDDEALGPGSAGKLPDGGSNHALAEACGNHYRSARIPSYTDRVLALHGPAAASMTRRLEQGDAKELTEHSDHGPVYSIFSTAFLPHAPLPDELAFEDTWHLEVRSLSVRVSLGKLREAEGGWGHMYGDRWLGSKPALHASVEANFLLRGSEELPAPRPPGTIVQGRGRETELVARWERVDLALSPLASQLGLAWLQTDDFAIHLHAGDATPHVPLGSSRFAIETSTASPSGAVQAGDPCTQEMDAVASLSWCGVYCGAVRLAFAFRMAGSDVSQRAASRGPDKSVDDRRSDKSAVSSERSVATGRDSNDKGARRSIGSLGRITDRRTDPDATSLRGSIKQHLGHAATPPLAPIESAPEVQPPISSASSDLIPPVTEDSAATSLGVVSEHGSLRTLSLPQYGSTSREPTRGSAAAAAARRSQSDPAMAEEFNADETKSTPFVVGLSRQALIFRSRLMRRPCGGRRSSTPSVNTEGGREADAIPELTVLSSSGKGRRSSRVTSTMPLSAEAAASAAVFDDRTSKRRMSVGVPMVASARRSSACSAGGAKPTLGRGGSLFGSPTCATEWRGTSEGGVVGQLERMRSSYDGAHHHFQPHETLVGSHPSAAAEDTLDSAESLLLSDDEEEDGGDGEDDAADDDSEDSEMTDVDGEEEAASEVPQRLLNKPSHLLEKHESLEDRVSVDMGSSVVAGMPPPPPPPSSPPPRPSRV